MKPNLSALMVGVVAWMLTIPSAAIIQTIFPTSAASARNMPDPDFSKLSLSAKQQKQFEAIMKPQIMPVLTSSQQKQLDANLSQGQSFWQALRSLNLSVTQQSKVKDMMKSQRFKIVKILTPEQREKLMQSGRPPF
jgi:Spy/CpxP family protein refolding chaperone